MPQLRQAQVQVQVLGPGNENGDGAATPSPFSDTLFPGRPLLGGPRDTGDAVPSRTFFSITDYDTVSRRQNAVAVTGMSEFPLFVILHVQLAGPAAAGVP